jgi:hypothetical protein
MNYARHEDKPFRMLAAFVAVMVGLILAGAGNPSARPNLQSALRLS